MPRDKKSRSSRKANSRPSNPTKNIVHAAAISGEAYLESRVLDVLCRSTLRQGLTPGELNKKSSETWQKALAVKLGLKKSKATSSDAQGYLYELWERGLIFVEPPSPGKKSIRVWAVENARARFPLLCPAPGTHSERETALTQQTLKSAYDNFVPDHLGGFVPIFKVRRQLSASKEEFDNLLKDLNELDDPVIDLLGGDPQQYTEDQKQDSLWRGENLFLRMRWR